MGCLVQGPCMLIEEFVIDLRKIVVNSSWYQMTTERRPGVQAAPIGGAFGGQTEELETVVHGFSTQDILVGEFTIVQRKSNRKYQVKLSQTEIHVSLLSRSNTSESPLVVKLADIIGVDCVKGKKSTDKGCYLTIYTYQRRKPASQSNIINISSRKRRPITLVFDKRATYSENEVAAVLWKNTIVCLLKGEKITPDMDLTSLQLPMTPRMLVLINPFSGPGKALEIFQQKVVPMFAEAGIHFNLVVTERAGHAYDMMRELTLSEWYGIVIVSGDGLIYEVINGLMQREDWEVAIKTPIGIIPGGSGNALSCSLNFHAGESFLEKHIQSATYLIAKHQVLPMDLMAIDTCTGRRLYSFLCVNWGYMSDVDIESEKMRVLGNARFTVGALVRLVGLRKYRGRISFLPVGEYVPREGKHKFRRSQSEVYTGQGNVETVRIKRSLSAVTEQIHPRDDDEDTTVHHSVGPSTVHHSVGPSTVHRTPGPSINTLQNGEGASVLSDSQTLPVVLEQNNGDISDEFNTSQDKRTVESSALNDPLIDGSDSFTDIDINSINSINSIPREENNVKQTVHNDNLTKHDDVHDYGSAGKLSQGSAGGTSYMVEQDVIPVDTPLLSPLSQAVPSNWITIDGEFVTVAILLTTHLGPDLIFSKSRRLDEGQIDLCIIHSSVSRAKLLKSFLDLAEGKVKPGGDIEFLRVKAFRIEPLTEKGYMVVDGEVVEYGAIQGQILPRMSRVMAKQK